VSEAKGMLEGCTQPVAAEFDFLLAAAQDAVVLTEDHNYWIDARAMYYVRQVFLEFGRRFASARVVALPEDVFYLTSQELKDTARALPQAQRHALIAERRAEVERFRAVSPPPMLGTRPQDMAPEFLLDSAPDGRLAPDSARAARPGLLRGHAGSPGSARGTARVLRSLNEAGSVKPGDILVAKTLSSSWTPLFAIAAAVVTDAGGILSHSAVVAREYGIPAVLGTEVATGLIADGQTVEVDGDRGTVRVEFENDGAR
jgi:rifampicin phosphotransferase